MALLHVGYFSKTLELHMNMDVILPERTPPKDGWPVLYLLHGLSDDHTGWQRRTSIERYAEVYDLCVVMPTTFRGFYTDAVRAGGKHFTHITKDVPEVVKNLFHVTEKQEDTFAAGLSMGGYGALKLGLLYPEHYAAVATLSGAIDIVSIMENENEHRDEFMPIFGENPRGTENDLFAQSEELAIREKGLTKRLAIYQCCGTEDFLFEDNRRYRDKFLDKLNLKYEEWSGVHDWAFWDVAIKKTLAWLPLRKKTIDK